MPSSERLDVGGGSFAGLAPSALCRGAAPAAPFRFHTPRCLIDWRALHALDLAAVVRQTDLDSLEAALPSLHSGDIEAEDARNLTPANFIQLFRAAQLTLDYLLHVQDWLAADGGAMRGDAARLRQQVQLLRLEVREAREELACSRKEARHLKKAARSFEALALAHQRAPPPAPEVRVVERVVEVADPAAATRLARLEEQLAQLNRERQDLQRDNSRLAEALATAAAAQEGSRADAVERARREEREGAAARLQDVLERERLAGRRGLDAARQRERQAGGRADAAALEAAWSSQAAAAAAADAKRLRLQLESAQAEAGILRSQLGRLKRERSPSRAGGRLSSTGLAAELEDGDELRIQQLEQQVEAQQAKLAAAEAALSQAAQRSQRLEQQLTAAEEQHSGQPGSAATATQAVLAAHAMGCQQELERLRCEKAGLREECRRLRQQAVQDVVEIEHLTQRVQQLPDGMGGRSQPSSRSMSPNRAGYRSAAGTRRSASQPPARRRNVSSIDDGEAAFVGTPAAIRAPASPGAHSAQRPGSRPGSARSRQPAGSPRAALPPPHGQAHGDASLADRQQFRREMQHSLHGTERPGVVGRFPHSLGSFLALRPDLQVELEAELASELASYGLDPGTLELGDGQLAAALAELERRREAAQRSMTPSDQQRMHFMRRTAAWHVQRMAERASGGRDASPAKRPKLVPAPPLQPIRTRSGGEQAASPRRRGLVERVLEQVGDEDATYSPLAHGASVLSDRGYLEGLSPPHSATSPAGLSDAGGGPPRSPWSLPHSGAAQAGLGQDGRSRSPLGHACEAEGAARGVRFGDGDMEAAQRVGRRPSLTRTPASSPTKRAPVSRQLFEDVLRPASRRVAKLGGEIQPGGGGDSRDWDTREAAAVRPGGGAAWGR